MKSLLLFFKKSYRLILLPILLVIIAYYLIVVPIFGGSIINTLLDPIGAAILLMLINTIYLEHIFTTPKDSIVNSLNAMVIAILIYFAKPGLTINAILLSAICLIAFFTGLMFVLTFSKYSKNYFLLKISSSLGRAKILFVIVVVLSFISIKSHPPDLSIVANTNSLLYIFLFYVAFLLLTFHASIDYIRSIPIRLFNLFKSETIGVVIGNYSPNIVFVKFQAGKIKINDLVYIGDVKDKTDYNIYNRSNIAIIFDFIGMQSEKDEVVARGYLLKQPQRDLDEFKNGLVKSNQDCFKVIDPEGFIDSLNDDTLKYYWKRKNDMVALVSTFSNINLLKGDIIKHRQLENAQLVSIINDSIHNPIRYQIIEGETHKYESEEESGSGYTKLTAYQLGEWRHPKNEKNEEDKSKLHQFFEFQWVPQINSPVFKWNKDYDETNISDAQVDKSGYYLLGNIPKTNLPIYLNVQDLVSHHTAILGVTGSGKSTLVFKLLNEILNQNILLMCIDITGEYRNRLTEYEDFFDDETKKKWDDELLKIVKDKVPENIIREAVKNINTALAPRIEKLRTLKKVCIIDIPELSNTKFSLDFTQYLIGAIIEYSKNVYLNNFSKVEEQKDKFKCCLILEEAHTLVPENLGVGGDFGASKAVIDKLSQIALQGRKYNVGFILISQRTATVKKTVLNQCNTMISFRAYDETSFNFLSSYFGEEYVKQISHLKNDGDSRYVIVAGKAVVADRPVVVEIKK